MAFDGNGVYSLPVTTVTPAVSTTTIDSADFNTFTGDIETALSLCITNDGQTSTPRINNPNINEAVNMTATSTELNLLDGATVTTAEINNIDGGTSATSTTVATGDRVVYNDNGTMVQVDVDDVDTYFSATTKTLTNKTLTSPVITSFAGEVITSGTVAATTSGSTVDYTNIPSWVKKITINLDGVSTNGTQNIAITIGDSGGLETSGYVSRIFKIIKNCASIQNSTSIWQVCDLNAAEDLAYGYIVLTLLDSTTNTWVQIGNITVIGASSSACSSAGSKSLTGTLDRLQIVTTDTFDAGKVNILYEG